MVKLQRGQTEYSTEHAEQAKQQPHGIQIVLHRFTLHVEQTNRVSVAISTETTERGQELECESILLQT